jgi:hypothetical protein
MGNLEYILYFYYMTNVQISKRGREILRNKAARSAIAKALRERAHEVATDGVLVEVEGKKYLVKSASAFTEEEIASMNKR